MNLHLYFPHLLAALCEIWYKRSEHCALTICGSHENWCREGHSFLMGVNEITCMYVQSAIKEYSICSHLISSPTATSYKLIFMKIRRKMFWLGKM